MSRSKLLFASKRLKTSLFNFGLRTAKSLSLFLILSDGGIYVRGPQLGLLDKLLSQNRKVFPGAAALAVWYPLNPISVRNWFSPEVSFMSQFPRGRLGNRILELALGMQIARDLGGIEFVMIRKKCDNDEEIFCKILKLSGITETIREKKTSPRLRGSVQSTRRSRVIQIDFLSFAEAMGVTEKDLVQRAFSALRASVPSVWQDPVDNEKLPVVLHFRATDRLTAAQDREYRPPPLAFFRKAVQIEGCKDLLLLTDDPESGLVESLVQQMTSDGVKVTVQKNSLIQDFSLMTLAETLILPSSSLSDSAAGLNTNLKRIYVYAGRRTIRNDVEVVELRDSSGRWEKQYSSLGNDFEVNVKKLMAGIKTESITYQRISPTKT